MSTALAVQESPDGSSRAAVETPSSYDFEKVFGPISDEFDFGMDICGLDTEAMDGVKSQSMMRITGLSTLQVYYATSSYVSAGYLNLPNSHRVRSSQEAADAMGKAAQEQASSEITWNRLHHEVTGENALLAFRSNKDRIELGRVGKTYHAFSGCTGCSGKGQIRCCFTGDVQCWKCRGHGRYSEVSSSYNGSKVLWFNCAYCSCSGRIPCGHCGGRVFVDCLACEATGGFTHVHSGTMYGVIESDFSYNGGDYFDEAAEYIKRPADEVIAQSFVATPTWNKSRRPFVGTLAMQVPVQRFTTETTQFGQSHKFDLSFAGRDQAWVLRYPFVDPLIEPYVQRLERSAGIEAFNVANETTLGGALVKSSIEDDTSPTVVVDMCKGFISATTVERILRTLDREAKRLTRGPVRRAWIQSNVAALIIWAMTATLFGASLRRLFPPSDTGEAYIQLGLIWIVLVPVSVGMSYLWGQRAACRSLSRILREPVTRCPGFGGRAVLGSLGLVVIITFAVAGFAPGRTNGTQNITQGIERTR